MTFEYQNNRYRIGFAHDPSRTWADHAGCEVSFERQLTIKSKPRGRPYLICKQHGIRLAPSASAPADRNVNCTLYVEVRTESQPTWTLIESADANLNLDAGDRYSPEYGRKAALNRVLKEMPAEFRRRALHAYAARKPQHKYLCEICATTESATGHA